MLLIGWLVGSVCSAALMSFFSSSLSAELHPKSDHSRRGKKNRDLCQESHRSRQFWIFQNLITLFIFFFVIHLFIPSSSVAAAAAA